MKKIFLIFALLLMFSSTLVVSAQEINPAKSTPTESIDSFLSQLEEKLNERQEEQDSRWSDRQEDRHERNTSFLEIVAQYAPELLSDYTTAFATHNALHEELYNTRTSIQTTYSNETLAALNILKEDLIAQAEAGEITWKEVRETLRNFLKDSRETFQSQKSAYKDAILAANADWEAKVAEIKVLRADLVEAIKTNDNEAAAEIIETLYGYLIEHIEFDQFKLDTMKSIF